MTLSYFVSKKRRKSSASARISRVGTACLWHACWSSSGWWQVPLTCRMSTVPSTMFWAVGQLGDTWVDLGNKSLFSSSLGHLFQGCLFFSDHPSIRKFLDFSFRPCKPNITKLGFCQKQLHMESNGRFWWGHGELVSAPDRLFVVCLGHREQRVEGGRRSQRQSDAHQLHVHLCVHFRAN